MRIYVKDCYAQVLNRTLVDTQSMKAGGCFGVLREERGDHEIGSIQMPILHQRMAISCRSDVKIRA